MSQAPSTPAKPIMLEVGPGEMIDKITILKIKTERMTDPQKVANVTYELEVLEKARQENLAPSETLTQLENDLKQINEALWEIEDDIRQCEADKDFGDEFIRLARAVYITNDKRAAVKKQINLHAGSAIIEEKSYTEFE